MSKRITLKEALTVWREQTASEESLGRHILPLELYELLVEPTSDESKDSLLFHLTRCHKCIMELRGAAESIEEAELWDLALPKAAASEEVQWPKKIPTEGGKYTIVIRRSISDKNKGVITLQVEPAYRDGLEGKGVVVRDGQGQHLLRGKIMNGEVSQEIEELDRIIPQFLVEPE